MADDGITLQTVLEHMQNMQQTLSGQIREIRETMATKTDLQHLEVKVDRNHASLTQQIDALDQRLDAIEIENLPKRVTKLEQVVGVGQ
jgi:predicted  nucleic acid-binding Zn-ribbon protein